MTPYWALSDEELLAQCDWQAGRASGPGGQKRNKTHSAIDIRHRPTGLTVTANEHRMQGENRRLALIRLRHALAVSERQDIDLETFTVPEEVLAQRVGKGGKLAVAPDNPRYLTIIALLLDLLLVYRGHIAPAADRLGISTTNFINLLHRDPKLWTAAQQLRQRFGQSPIKP